MGPKKRTLPAIFSGARTRQARRPSSCSPDADLETPDNRSCAASKEIIPSDPLRESGGIELIPINEVNSIPSSKSLPYITNNNDALKPEPLTVEIKSSVISHPESHTVSHQAMCLLEPSPRFSNSNSVDLFAPIVGVPEKSSDQTRRELMMKLRSVPVPLLGQSSTHCSDASTAESSETETADDDDDEDTPGPLSHDKAAFHQGVANAVSQLGSSPFKARLRNPDQDIIYEGFK